MINISKILPKTANNELDSPKLAIWGFIVFTALMTWRAIIHMFFESYGFHDIANFKIITGEPDPMPIIYRFFSLWGSVQLLFCMICWVVIFRYKSLIPLMYVFWLLEWGSRIFFYPIIREDIAIMGLYTNNITPGVEFAPYIVILIASLFLLSLTDKKN